MRGIPMRRPVDTLPIEKWLLLFAATIAAVAIQQFLASSPVALMPGQPVAIVSPPKCISLPQTANSDETAIANAEIWTPFATWYRPSKYDPRKETIRTVNFINPTNLDLAGGTVVLTQIPKSWPARDLESIYEYMGVVVFNGDAYGMLRPRRAKDSVRAAEPRRVKLDEFLPDCECTVTRVEPQAIWLTHRDGKIFVLKDKSKLAM
jgi:hypothetical protein